MVSFLSSEGTANFFSTTRSSWGAASEPIGGLFHLGERQVLLAQVAGRVIDDQV